MRPPERGFTLLEVLAAVAVLSILYTVLAGVAIRGLRAEGDSRRRLEASLLADGQLAEVEMEIAAMTAPPIGRTELEIDDFLVAVEVSEASLPVPAQASGEEEDLLSLLVDARGNRISPVRTIEVTVGWTEDGLDRSVVRTTYAFDFSEAPALGGAAPLEAR